MHPINGLTCCTLLLLSVDTPLQAASVFRCEDSRGHITYTQQGCPADQQLDIQSADNLPPGADAPVTMAPGITSALKKARKSTPAKDLTIVAEQQDGCGNRVTGAQRRTAIIRQQIRAGMTREDVESALGKPDEKSTANGDTQYIYTTNDGTRRKINFDQNGCVKNKH